MEYTVKLSKTRAEELRHEAILFGMEDIGHYVLEKLKAGIRREESKPIRNLIGKRTLSAYQKNILREFGREYFENLSNAKIFYRNEEHFIVRLTLKLKKISF